MAKYIGTTGLGYLWEKIKAAFYQKPSGGIPKTDLSSAVQTSLGKADTALQSFTETDPTVPAWAKASTKPTYTAAEVGALPDTTVIPNDSNLVHNTGNETIYGIKSFLDDVEIDDTGGHVFKFQNGELIYYISYPRPVGPLNANWNFLKASAGTISSSSETVNYETLQQALDARNNVQANWNETNTSSDAYIKNKPTIPAAQVNSDWNASSGVAQILNKPTIPNVSQVANTGTSVTVGSTSYNIVATSSPSGNAATYTAPSWSALSNAYGELNFRAYIDGTSISINADEEMYVKSVNADKLTNGTTNKVFTATEQTKLADIAAGAEVNVQANWNETDTSSDAYILNKPTIPAVDVALTTSELDEAWDTVFTAIISFTIDASTYQAEEDMTWGEWVNSEYNTDYYYIYDNYIENVAADEVRDSTHKVAPSETIVANYAYYT